jgi:hypothetical protein
MADDGGGPSFEATAAALVAWVSACVHASSSSLFPITLSNPSLLSRTPPHTAGQHLRARHARDEPHRAGGRRARGRDAARHVRVSWAVG